MPLPREESGRSFLFRSDYYQFEVNSKAENRGHPDCGEQPLFPLAGEPEKTRHRERDTHREENEDVCLFQHHMLYLLK